MNAIVGTNINCLKESINFFRGGDMPMNSWFKTLHLKIRAAQNYRSEPFEIVEAVIELGYTGSPILGLVWF